MDFNLQGRVIFIAGASRGIGLGIAEACLAEGARLALTAIDAEELAQTHARLAGAWGADRVWSKAANMRETAAIDDAVTAVERDFGAIYGAVANVGISPTIRGFDVPDDAWEAALAQNLSSAFRLARAVLKLMTARKEGALLLVSSIAGLSALGGTLGYGTSKAGVNHMCKELARMVGPDGVRVNAIAPGNINFPGGGIERILAGEHGDDLRALIDREVPMKRFGTPEEIGATAAFMLSSRASFMTGSVVRVDGGQLR